jgi:hypothetical protein
MTVSTALAILLSGALATLFWLTVSFSVSIKGLGYGGVIESIGNDIRTERLKPFTRGVLIYLVIGLLLAPLYYFLIQLFNFENVIVSMGVSVFFGIAQGFLLMHLLVEEPYLYQPSRMVSDKLIPLSVVFWLSNMAYGVAVGACLAAYLDGGGEGIAIAGLAIMVACLIITHFARKGAGRDLREIRH